MTVQVTTTFTRAAGNGGTTVFNFPFKIFDATDLVVRDIVDSTGVPSTKTNVTDYAVTISATGEGGSVTMVTAPATGHTLDIRSNIPVIQAEDIRNQGRFLPEIHEGVFDKLARLIQDARRLIGLSIQAPDYEAGTRNLTLPNAVQCALNFLSFDAAGNVTVSSGTGGGDASLRTDLANTTTAGKGTDMVSYRRTTYESANSITPVVFGYPAGDVRRFVSGAADQGSAWYCYGHTATYFSATQFFLTGDFTSIYKSMTRVLVLGNAGVTGNLLVLSSSFAAGTTNVFLVDDSVSPLPNPILAVSIQVASDARGPAISTYNSNFYNGGQIIANLNTGGNAVARTTITTRDAAGVSNCAAVLVAVPPTYTHDAGSGAGVFLTGGFSTQTGLTAPYAVLYSQVGCSLDIGTADTSRIGIPHNGTAIVIKTDLTVNAGNGATNRSNLTINGLVDARLAFNSNSAEKGAVYASATEMLMGSTAALDTTITQNGNRVLTFRGGNTTGASTPTLSANKPGANAGVIEWVAVKTSTGTTGWQPIWGN